MSKNEVVAVEQPTEVISTDNLNDDKINAIIHLASRTEELGKALDTIRKFVLARALPGDFVKFGEAGKDGYLELVGAGADRIASALGISFRNFRDWKEAGEDKYGAHYTWFYKCDVDFRGRVIESVEGRCGT